MVSRDNSNPAQEQIRPDSVHVLFERLFNAGDLDSILMLYEPEAVMIDRDGKTVSGTAAIGEFMRGYLASKPHITIKRQRTIAAGDIAILISEWQITATGPDGSPMSESGRTRDIVHRQPDGTWKAVVNNPWSVTLREAPVALSTG